MTLSADLPTASYQTGARSRPRLSPIKWNRWPIALQMALSFACAIAFMTMISAIAPDMATPAKVHIHTATHEGGHAIAALIQQGEVYDITLRSDGSGAVTSTSRDTVLTAGGGLLLPILIAVLLIVAAATRTLIEVFCLLIAIPFFWLGYQHAHVPDVRWALWGWAAFAVLFAVPGIPYVFKSAGLLVISITLIIGVFDSIGYLSVEYVTDHDAPVVIGGVTEPAQLKSDVRHIADAFSEDGIENTRAMILLIMGFISFAALCVLAHFLNIYRRR